MTVQTVYSLHLCRHKRVGKDNLRRALEERDGAVSMQNEYFRFKRWSEEQLDKESVGHRIVAKTIMKVVVFQEIMPCWSLRVTRLCRR